MKTLEQGIEGALTSVLTLIIALPIGFVVCFYRIFFLSYLYEWFLIPLGAKPVSIWVLYGAMLFWNTWSMRPQHINNLEGETAYKLEFSIAMGFLTPPLAWLMGWMIKTWLM